MENTIKNFFEDDNLIITKISQGYNGKVRVDVRRRYPKPDQPNRMSKWCKEIYANKLAIENYGKKVSEFRCYEY